MVKVSRIGIRIEDDLKEQAEAFAKADRRSLSSWVEALIAREVERLSARKARQDEKK